MKERTLRVLEFTRIREMLAEGALTEAGAEKCRTLVPLDDLAPALAAQAETEEAAVILQYIGGHPMAAFPDVRPALGICEKGGTLSAGMLLSVAEMLLTGIDELRIRCEPTGPLGAFLTKRVLDALAAYDGYSRPIWDISAPGYFLVPDAFQYEFVPTPSVDDTSAWKSKTERYEMVLVQHISRDPIFSCLFDLLNRAPEN